MLVCLKCSNEMAGNQLHKVDNVYDIVVVVFKLKLSQAENEVDRY